MFSYHDRLLRLDQRCSYQIDIRMVIYRMNVLIRYIFGWPSIELIFLPVEGKNITDIML